MDKRCGEATGHPGMLQVKQHSQKIELDAMGWIRMEIQFDALPNTLERFIRMPQFDLTSPHHVAALYVVALCAYPHSPSACFNMIDAIKGPQRLTPMERQYIQNHMVGKAGYIGKSYFNGALPGNDYLPYIPYTITVFEHAKQGIQNGFCVLLLCSGGAKQPREVTLRNDAANWFLWEHAELLADIQPPMRNDPWKDS
ncbi:hypothetical protein LJC55_04005 [Eubacteriales bacterium OttesenSCG-928-N14]|nr:hypothetical protein [Eubacteriales bacterium OttesenSCG-928-N14]